MKTHAINGNQFHAFERNSSATGATAAKQRTTRTSSYQGIGGRLVWSLLSKPLKEHSIATRVSIFFFKFVAQRSTQKTDKNRKIVHHVPNAHIQLGE